MKELTNDEKHDLMVLLMKDIRGYWGENAQMRVYKVLEWARDLKYANTIECALEYIRISEDTGSFDGRHFRDCAGGYDDYELKLVNSGKLSSAFKEAVLYYFESPEYAFEVYL